MADLPTIFISNWSSSKTPGHHGPGRKLTIMRAPRAWEHGDGRVPGLLPTLGNLNDVKAGLITVAEYRTRYEAGLAVLDLSTLYTTAEGGTDVRDGDTLCCACSKDAAAKGECHRVWAAEALVRAEWNVVLDGVKMGVPRA